MPKYQVKCKTCGNEFEEYAMIKDRYKIKCNKCGGDTKIQIVSSSLHVWKPYWEENISYEPIWIDSKKKLKRECDKHGCIAARLD